jgi:copper chaperone CopZ
MMSRARVIFSLLVALWLSAGALADGASDRTSVFRVEGMTCALCGKAIDRALREIEGVHSVAVNQKAERVTVITDGSIAPERLEQAIESAGSYKAELIAVPDAAR